MLYELYHFELFKSFVYYAIGPLSRKLCFSGMVQASAGKIPSYMVPSVGEVFWEMLRYNKEVGIHFEIYTSRFFTHPEKYVNDMAVTYLSCRLPFSKLIIGW